MVLLIILKGTYEPKDLFFLLVFSGNRSLDYEDASQGQPLADTWLQSQDTRKYAEKLTKYSPAKRTENFEDRPQDFIPVNIS